MEVKKGGRSKPTVKGNAGQRKAYDHTWSREDHDSPPPNEVNVSGSEETLRKTVSATVVNRNTHLRANSVNKKFVPEMMRPTAVG